MIMGLVASPALVHRSPLIVPASASSGFVAPSIWSGTERGANEAGTDGVRNMRQKSIVDSLDPVCGTHAELA